MLLKLSTETVYIHGIASLSTPLPMVSARTHRQSRESNSVEIRKRDHKTWAKRTASHSEESRVKKNNTSIYED